MKRSVYFVGSESEVSHHAAPLKSADSFSVKVIDANKVVAVAEPGDVAIFFSEHFERFRQAVVELKAKRVATIYLVDGILEWRNAWENSKDEPACPTTMRPVLCDKVAAIGPSQARVLAGWGNAGKIEVIGLPRLDNWTESWRETPSQGVKNGSGSFRVLVATAKTPGFTDEQIDTTVRSLTDLRSWFEATKNIGGRPIEVSWRLTAGLENRIGVENALSDLAGGELQDAIQNCDAFVTTPSTAMLEAMLQHKPTALLNYHRCPVYVPAAWNICSRDSIAAIMQQLTDASASQLHFQNSILADALQVAQPATGRLVQLIHSMLAACDKQIQSGKPLEFEANLLPNPFFASQLTGAHCKMDHASVFADHPEFSEAMEVTEMQSQLLHARREIEHLHRIQDGLRAELAEAHSIFEQIHQHPIAGPIVRIRERVIQFMNRNKDHS